VRERIVFWRPWIGQRRTMTKDRTNREKGTVIQLELGVGVRGHERYVNVLRERERSGYVPLQRKEIIERKKQTTKNKKWAKT
jgi:hypothetical protein